MNILDKIYINDHGCFNKISGNILVVTSCGRKKTSIFKFFLSSYHCVEVNEEPEIEFIDKIYNTINKENYDYVISYGGGSVIDTAKILSVALFNKLNPIDLLENFSADKKIKLVAIPTTFGSGSEVTSIGVYKRKGRKVSLKNDLLIPDSVFLFDESFNGIPKNKEKEFIADAFCHAIESFYSKNSNSTTKYISALALQIICDNVSTGNKINLALGSIMAGIAENIAGVSIIHAIAYPLQNKLSLPHAFSNSVILGYCEDSSMLGDNGFRALKSYNLFPSKIKLTIRKLSSPINSVDFLPQEFAHDCLSYTKLLSNSRIDINVDFLIKFYKNIKDNYVASK